VLDTSRIEPTRQEGAPIPLFDRLEDDEPGIPTERPIKRFYSKPELVESIEREVGRLLNTRTSATKEVYQELGATVINFGLPEMYGLADFSKVDGPNMQQWDTFCRLCEQTISFYEPRLTNVQATVIGYEREKQGLNIQLQADLAVGKIQTEVTFPLFLDLTR
jgi:type VI secretion system protein ImpF